MRVSSYWDPLEAHFVAPGCDTLLFNVEHPSAKTHRSFPTRRVVLPAHRSPPESPPPRAVPQRSLGPDLGTLQSPRSGHQGDHQAGRDSGWLPSPCAPSIRLEIQGTHEWTGSVFRAFSARVGVRVPLVRVIVGLRVVRVRLTMRLHVDALFGRMPSD